MPIAAHGDKYAEAVFREDRAILIVIETFYSSEFHIACKSFIQRIILLGNGRKSARGEDMHLQPVLFIICRTQHKPETVLQNDFLNP